MIQTWRGEPGVVSPPPTACLDLIDGHGVNLSAALLADLRNLQLDYRIVAFEIVPSGEPPSWFRRDPFPSVSDSSDSASAIRAETAAPAIAAADPSPASSLAANALAGDEARTHNLSSRSHRS